MMNKAESRWRMILGSDSGLDAGREPTEDEISMDSVLETVYGTYSDGAEGIRGAGSGSEISRCLYNIHRLFQPDHAYLLQRDLIKRAELKKLLSSPEAISSMSPDVYTASAFFAAREIIPACSLEAVREYVGVVVRDLRAEMEAPLMQAVSGIVNLKTRAFNASRAVFDIKRTVEKNLKHYDMKTKTIIPEALLYSGRTRRAKELEVVIAMDQSASMYDSMLYAAVMGAVLNKMPALDVKTVAFDHRVADVTQPFREDPITALLGLQMGGGTHIAPAVSYCAELMEKPDSTLFILLSDLYDEGEPDLLAQALVALKESGCTVVVLLALNSRGRPAHNEETAARLSSCGIICASSPPEGLAGLLESALKSSRGKRL